jgi:N utilization substance protein A
MAMNAPEMMRILDSIARDRNIDRSLLIRDLELAMVSAARKHFNTLDPEEFTCNVDAINGKIDIRRHGEPLEMSPEAFGRIAAQTFKQVMIQKFRDDERTSILDEFTKRVGDIVTGVAQRYEARQRSSSRSTARRLHASQRADPRRAVPARDRVRCLILDVRDAGSRSRSSSPAAPPDFIKRLFEVEVPEVAERIIEIKAMAREAGYRTKIAVSSVDSKVDAVGACVGVRGSRIKNIVDELNGEKIDIVRWNESSQILIQNALKPAEVAEISLCFELGRATVVVRDDQLSLAIGKRGQNVRLAARLTGWDIDILTPEEFTKGLETMSQTLVQVGGVTEQMTDKLAALGMVSVFDIEEVGADVLMTELQIGEDIAKAMVERASTRAKEVAEQQHRDKEEKERKARAQAEADRTAIVSGEAGEAGEAAASAILGGGGAPAAAAAAPDTSGEDRAADILGQS